MWVAIALICAFSLASSDALTKSALRGMDERALGWLRLLFPLPFLLVAALVSGIPKLDGTFYLSIAISIPLELSAYVLYIRALKVSPMSLSFPFLSFTPVFMLLISYVILGEKPSLQGGIGVALIASGGYVLNLHHIRHGLLGPVRAIFRERGSVMMLAVAFLYSFTASLGKLGVVHSSPLFFGFSYAVAMSVSYTPLGLPSLRSARITRAQLAIVLAIGALDAVATITHVLAISMTKAAYMIAVKRTSLLFSVLYGCLLFREGHFGSRSLGALIMFAGFVILVLAV